MSDKTLHALAKERPTTLREFGNIFGIGEYKKETYGERFMAVIKKYAEEEKSENVTNTLESAEISYMEQQKQLHEKAYSPWTKEDDEQLIELYQEGKDISEIMSIFKRGRGAIRSRLKKLFLNLAEKL